MPGNPDPWRPLQKQREKNTVAKNDPVELKSRLTLKEMGCDASRVLDMAQSPGNRANQGLKLRLAHIYGVATKCGVQIDQRNNSEYVYFLGNFEGVNLDTGEVSQASKLYLPPGASETLEVMLNRVQERRKGASVNFAFEIVAAPSEDARCGYAYETRTILQPEQADMLDQVRGAVKEYADKETKKEPKGKPAAA
jgi:hypothetical protein